MSLPMQGIATVKSVQSGDSVILTGVPVNGPPSLLQMSLSSIQAPRFGKEPGPFAFQSREFLRSLVGLRVKYRVESTSSSSRHFGSLQLQNPIEGENDVGTLVVKMGMGQYKGRDESLILLQQRAQEGRVGMWGDEETVEIRDVDEGFLGRWKGKEMKGFVEHVRDASTFRIVAMVPNATNDTGMSNRANIDDTFNSENSTLYTFNILLSGIKAPLLRQHIPNTPDLIEPFAEEAKYFVENRLLQRNVTIILEGSDMNAFYASVIHPKGNIAELLLGQGLAKVVDWNLSCATHGEHYKDIELKAQREKVRLWKDFKVINTAKFNAVVTRIIGPDLLMIEPVGKKEIKVQFSSVRGPKRTKTQNLESGYFPDAIEFLRSRLIGQTVQVTVDYIKPAEGEFEERICVTIIKGEQNMGESLVSRGLALVMRHRRDDDARSPAYAGLLEAEERAKVAGKNLHSTADLPVHRFVDASENVARARSYMMNFQRSGTMSAIVEHVASGSRFKVFLPTQNIKLTLILAGIKTPRAPRSGEKGEPCGAEAAIHTSRLVLQRQVEITIEGQDKVGGFIGSMFFEGTSLALSLVEKGLASIHHQSASTLSYYPQLRDAETRAQSSKLNIWLHQPEIPIERISIHEPKVQTCIVTEVLLDGLYIQLTDIPAAKPKFAKLAYVSTTEDFEIEALECIKHLVHAKEVECKTVAHEQVILSLGNTNVNVQVLSEGLGYIAKGVRRNNDLEPFFLAQDEARRLRLGVWEYGDFLDDDE